VWSHEIQPNSPTKALLCLTTEQFGRQFQTHRWIWRSWVYLKLPWLWTDSDSVFSKHIQMLTSDILVLLHLNGPSLRVPTSISLMVKDVKIKWLYTCRSESRWHCTDKNGDLDCVCVMDFICTVNFLKNKLWKLPNSVTTEFGNLLWLGGHYLWLYHTHWVWKVQKITLPQYKKILVS
jgi:hypothetical protein